MPTPTQTQLQTGLGGAIGCDFRTAQNELIFIEYNGKLSALTVAPAVPAYRVLGTGYNQPEDVKLSVDGVHAYITERTGDLVRLALSNAGPQRRNGRGLGDDGAPAVVSGRGARLGLRGRVLCRREGCSRSTSPAAPRPSWPPVWTTRLVWC